MLSDRSWLARSWLARFCLSRFWLSQVWLAAAVLFVADVATAADTHVLENAFLRRTLSTANGVLRTIDIVNKLAGVTARPTSADEFRLRLSQGTDRPETAFTLTTADFHVVEATRDERGVAFQLDNAPHGLRVEVRYELPVDDFYLRKRLSITAIRPITLERMGTILAGFFKLDGLFGHLNLRNFELHGSAYGLPEMPHLGVDGFTSGDKRLNEAKYDELKIYYLTAGTERLIRIFDRLAAIDPHIYIVISNGAYLSPWWLMHVDAVWMINAGYAAGGSSRTAELVYRDDRYHEIWHEQKCQFPMCSIFNHEPKKTSTGEPKRTFREYLSMHLSRGTPFIELYIKPFVLQPGDWDVVSEGLFWAEDVFPTFARARMHGGSPKAGEVYGYTAWDADQGYASVHNPSDSVRSYTVTLDRSFGLVPGSGPFYVSSPIEGSTRDLPSMCAFGDSLTFRLEPREIRVVNFSQRPKDWTKLRQLQARSPEPVEAPAMPIAGHPILGSWEYEHSGRTFTRTFEPTGICTLRQDDAILWQRRFRVDSPTRVTVEDGLRHVVSREGTLEAEGRYIARRLSVGGGSGDSR